jgi:hypothetical protein
MSQIEKLTGSTITDDQIRALRKSLPRSADGIRIAHVCGAALGEPGYHAEAKPTARGRCAQILSERADGSSPL